MLGYLIAFACLIASVASQGTKWTQTSGAALDVGVNHNGDLWVIGMDNGIYNYLPSSNSWNKIDGAGYRIAVDPQGNPWVIGMNWAVYRRVNGAWIQTSGWGIDLAISNDGAVFIVDGNNVTWQMNIDANTWTSLGYLGVKIAVDDSGNPIVVNPSGNVFYRNGNNWTGLNTAALDVGYGGGKLWKTGTDQGIYYYNPGSNTWTQVDGAAVWITVGGNGLPIVANSGYGIYIRS